ncbi:MAG: YcxB family protein [Candidatus Sulfotelmatobacter sp.]
MQLEYDITPAEHLEMVKTVRIRPARRLVRICLYGVGIFLGVAVYQSIEHVIGVFLISLFAALIILQIIMPYIVHRRLYSRNPRLYGKRTVTFDNEGLTSDSDLAHVEIKWSSFEKFKETKNLFLIYQTKDVAGITPKRAFPSSEAVEQFRNLLASKVRRD